VDSAVAKAFRVLEAVSDAHGFSRLSQLAADLGLQKSTVHRILGELVELGFVEQDETRGLYRPTLRTWEIGTTVVADVPIKQVASGALQQLHDATGETVSLTVRSGDDVLYLDKLISPRPMRFTTRVGSRVPLPLAASGKAILAVSPDGEQVVERLARVPELRDRIDVEQVLKALVEARRRGYAVSSARPGVQSFAAAVLDRNEEPVGALSVSAPTERLDRAKRSAIAEAAVSTALRLGESLGRL
jgi:DNA-binding IclR family transcriptional regulator